MIVYGVNLIFIALSILILLTNSYLHFDSQSSYAIAPDATRIESIHQSSFSISFWFRGVYPGNNPYHVNLLSIRSVSAYGSMLVTLHANWGGYTPLRPIIQMNYNYAAYNLQDVVTDGHWQYFVVTRENDINCTLKYWINGTEVYSHNKANACNADLAGQTGTGNKLWIGDDCCAAQGFIGDMAQITIWNRTLNENEIQKIYIRGGDGRVHRRLRPKHVSFDGLLHYYPLDEHPTDCENNSIIHDVFNGNDAILSSILDPTCIASYCCVSRRNSTKWDTICPTIHGTGGCRNAGKNGNACRWIPCDNVMMDDIDEVEDEDKLFYSETQYVNVSIIDVSFYSFILIACIVIFYLYNKCGNRSKKLFGNADTTITANYGSLPNDIYNM